MRKPTLYLDTTIFSTFHHRSGDVITLANRLKTREWWNQERQHFDLFVSRVVVQELSDGKYPWQQVSVRMAKVLPMLQITEQVYQLHQILIQKSVVPAVKPGDALQMAVAAVYSIDYLLTWNYSHLANADAQRKLEEVLGDFGLRSPLMVSPDTIPQVRFGTDPRRR